MKAAADVRVHPEEFPGATISFSGASWQAEWLATGATRRSGRNAGAAPVLVREVMSRNVVSISPTARLKDAVETMSRYCFTGLPVTDATNRPVGVLSEKDVLRTLRERAGLTYPKSLWDLILAEPDEQRPLLRYRLLHTLETSSVAGSMSSPALSVSPGDPITEAMKAMAAKGIHRLLVVEDGQLVGIVTRRDVLAALSPTE